VSQGGTPPVRTTDVIIPPHGFALASTVERFNLHDDLAGTVRDKSSWARVGLALQNTLLDPGWRSFDPGGSTACCSAP
jgi:deoxycytidine triphosphate deaminase